MNLAGYMLVTCLGTAPHCCAPSINLQGLTREQCVEHMQMISWLHPDRRVICRTYRNDDVIDSAGLLRPGWSE